jgi:transposase
VIHRGEHLAATPPRVDRGIAITRRGQEHGSGLGRWRWVVERSFAWLHNYRRLRLRWERNPNIHTALLTLAYAAICWRFLVAL